MGTPIAFCAISTGIPRQIIFQRSVPSHYLSNAASQLAISRNDSEDPPAAPPNLT